MSLLPCTGKGNEQVGNNINVDCQSKAACKGLLVHIQLQTKAQSAERKHMRSKMIGFLHDICGKFGHDEEKKHLVMIGLNKWGDMVDIEFE